FAHLLILAGFGAKITAADPFLQKWQPHYHPYFYRAFRREVVATRPTWPVYVLDEVIAREDHCISPLRALCCGLERLEGVPDDSCALTVSVAVSEPTADVAQAAGELFRVPRRGGVGLHQFDSRDPRDFSRPLEFLTLPESGKLSVGELIRGNRLR